MAEAYLNALGNPLKWSSSISSKLDESVVGDYARERLAQLDALLSQLDDPTCSLSTLFSTRRNFRLVHYISRPSLFAPAASLSPWLSETQLRLAIGSQVRAISARLASRRVLAHALRVPEVEARVWTTKTREMVGVLVESLQTWSSLWKDDPALCRAALDGLMQVIVELDVCSLEDEPREPLGQLEQLLTSLFDGTPDTEASVVQALVTFAFAEGRASRVFSVLASLAEVQQKRSTRVAVPPLAAAVAELARSDDVWFDSDTSFSPLGNVPATTAAPATPSTTCSAQQQLFVHLAGFGLARLDLSSPSSLAAHNADVLPDTSSVSMAVVGEHLYVHDPAGPDLALVYSARTLEQVGVVPQLLPGTPTAVHLVSMGKRRTSLGVLSDSTLHVLDTSSAPSEFIRVSAAPLRGKPNDAAVHVLGENNNGSLGLETQKPVKQLTRHAYFDDKPAIIDGGSWRSRSLGVLETGDVLVRSVAYLPHVLESMRTNPVRALDHTSRPTGRRFMVTRAGHVFLQQASPHTRFFDYQAALRGHTVVHCSCTTKHAYFVTDDGRLLLLPHPDAKKETLAMKSMANNGHDDDKPPELVHVASLAAERIHRIACGRSFVLALTLDGRVFAAGENKAGQLGIGKDADGSGHLDFAPVPLPPGVQIVDVACGDRHAVALAASGTVYTWGANDNGQQGHKTKIVTTVIYEPRPLSAETFGGARISQIACAPECTLFYTDTGTLFRTGYFMQTTFTTPKKVGDVQHVQLLRASQDALLVSSYDTAPTALDQDGAVEVMSIGHSFLLAARSADNPAELVVQRVEPSAPLALQVTREGQLSVPPESSVSFCAQLEAFVAVRFDAEAGTLHISTADAVAKLPARALAPVPRPHRRHTERAVEGQVELKKLLASMLLDLEALSRASIGGAQARLIPAKSADDTDEGSSVTLDDILVEDAALSAELGKLTPANKLRSVLVYDAPYRQICLGCDPETVAALNKLLESTWSSWNGAPDDSSLSASLGSVLGLVRANAAHVYSNVKPRALASVRFRILPAADEADTEAPFDALQAGLDVFVSRRSAHWLGILPLSTIWVPEAHDKRSEFERRTLGVTARVERERERKRQFVKKARRTAAETALYTIADVLARRHRKRMPSSVADIAIAGTPLRRLTRNERLDEHEHGVSIAVNSPSTSEAEFLCRAWLTDDVPKGDTEPTVWISAALAQALSLPTEEADAPLLSVNVRPDVRPVSRITLVPGDPSEARPLQTLLHEFADPFCQRVLARLEWATIQVGQRLTIAHPKDSSDRVDFIVHSLRFEGDADDDAEEEDDDDERKVDDDSDDATPFLADEADGDPSKPAAGSLPRKELARRRKRLEGRRVPAYLRHYGRVRPGDVVEETTGPAVQVLASPGARASATGEAFASPTSRLLGKLLPLAQTLESVIDGLAAQPESPTIQAWLQVASDAYKLCFGHAYHTWGARAALLERLRSQACGDVLLSVVLDALSDVPSASGLLFPQSLYQSLQMVPIITQKPVWGDLSDYVPPPELIPVDLEAQQVPLRFDVTRCQAHVAETHPDEAVLLRRLWDSLDWALDGCLHRSSLIALAPDLVAEPQGVRTFEKLTAEAPESVDFFDFVAFLRRVHEAGVRLQWGARAPPAVERPAWAAKGPGAGGECLGVHLATMPLRARTLLPYLFDLLAAPLRAELGLEARVEASSLVADSVMTSLHSMLHHLLLSLRATSTDWLVHAGAHVASMPLYAPVPFFVLLALDAALSVVDEISDDADPLEATSALRQSLLFGKMIPSIFSYLSCEPLCSFSMVPMLSSRACRLYEALHRLSARNPLHGNRPVQQNAPMVVKVIESEHPYPEAGVVRDVVRMPDDVEFMVVEFDPRCCTSQQEDSLRLYGPLHGKSPRRSALYSKFVGAPYCKGGTWPPCSLVMPGRELLFAFNSASDYREQPSAEDRWGYRLTVTGFRRAVDSSQADQVWLESLSRQCMYYSSCTAGSLVSDVVQSLDPLEAHFAKLMKKEPFAAGLDTRFVQSVFLSDKRKAERQLDSLPEDTAGWTAGEKLMRDIFCHEDDSESLANTLLRWFYQADVDVDPALCVCEPADAARHNDEPIEARIATPLTLRLRVCNEVGDALTGAAVDALVQSGELKVRASVELASLPIDPIGYDFEGALQVSESVIAMPERACGSLLLSGGGDLLYQFGGVSADDKPVADVWRVDLAAGTWTCAGELPTASRHLGGCALLDGRFFLFSTSAEGSQAWCCDESLQFKAVTLPAALASATDAHIPSFKLACGATSVVLDSFGSVHVLGGAAGEGAGHWVWNPLTMQWRESVRLPLPRFFHGTAVDPSRGTLFVFGGATTLSSVDETETQLLASSIKLRVGAQQWKPGTLLPRAAMQFGVLSLGHKALVVGGRFDEEGELSHALTFFDFDTADWQSCPSRLGAGVAASSLCQTRNRVHVCGGISSGLTVCDWHVLLTSELSAARGTIATEFAVLADKDAAAEPKVVKEDDGTFLIEFQLLRSGHFTLVVEVNGHPVQGMPLLSRARADWGEVDDLLRGEHFIRYHMEELWRTHFADMITELNARATPRAVASHVPPLQLEKEEPDRAEEEKKAAEKAKAEKAKAKVVRPPWACPTCAFSNLAESEECDMCGAANPTPVVAEVPEVTKDVPEVVVVEKKEDKQPTAPVACAAEVTLSREAASFLNVDDGQVVVLGCPESDADVRFKAVTARVVDSHVGAIEPVSVSSGTLLRLGALARGDLEKMVREQAKEEPQAAVTLNTATILTRSADKLSSRDVSVSLYSYGESERVPYQSRAVPLVERVVLESLPMEVALSPLGYRYRRVVAEEEHAELLRAMAVRGELPPLTHGDVLRLTTDGELLSGADALSSSVDARAYEKDCEEDALPEFVEFRVAALYGASGYQLLLGVAVPDVSVEWVGEFVDAPSVERFDPTPEVEYDETARERFAASCGATVKVDDDAESTESASVVAAKLTETPDWFKSLKLVHAGKPAKLYAVAWRDNDDLPAAAAWIMDHGDKYMADHPELFADDDALAEQTGRWACSVCTYRNDAKSTECEMCNLKRTEDVPDFLHPSHPFWNRQAGGAGTSFGGVLFDESSLAKSPVVDKIKHEPSAYRPYVSEQCALLPTPVMGAPKANSKAARSVLRAVFCVMLKHHGLLDEAYKAAVALQKGQETPLLQGLLRVWKHSKTVLPTRADVSVDKLHPRSDATFEDEDEDQEHEDDEAQDGALYRVDPYRRAARQFVRRAVLLLQLRRPLESEWVSCLAGDRQGLPAADDEAEEDEDEYQALDLDDEPVPGPPQLTRASSVPGMGDNATRPLFGRSRSVATPLEEEASGVPDDFASHAMTKSVDKFLKSDTDAPSVRRLLVRRRVRTLYRWQGFAALERALRTVPGDEPDCLQDVLMVLNSAMRRSSSAYSDPSVVKATALQLNHGEIFTPPVHYADGLHGSGEHFVALAARRFRSLYRQLSSVFRTALRRQDQPLLYALLHAWSVDFHAADQEFLHSSQVFPLIRRVMAMDDGEEEEDDEDEDEAKEEDGERQRGLLVRGLNEVTKKVSVTASSGHARLQNLFDGSTQTYWQSTANEDVPEWNRQPTSHWMLLEMPDDEDGAPLAVNRVLWAMDGVRDPDMCPQNVDVFAGETSEVSEMELVGKFRVSLEPGRWHTFSCRKLDRGERFKPDSDGCLRVKYLHFKILLCHGSALEARVRGLRVYSTPTERTEPRSELRPKKLVVHRLREHAISVFRRMVRRCFVGGVVLSGEEEDEADSDADADALWKRQSSSSKENQDNSNEARGDGDEREKREKQKKKEKEQAVEVKVEVESRRLSDLQRLVCELIFAELHRELDAVQAKGEVFVQQLPPVGGAAASEDATAREGEGDAYSYELLSLLASMSVSPAGARFMSSASFVNTLMAQLVPGSPRMQRALLGILKRVLPLSGPKRLEVEFRGQKDPIRFLLFCVASSLSVSKRVRAQGKTAGALEWRGAALASSEGQEVARLMKHLSDSSSRWRSEIRRVVREALRGVHVLAEGSGDVEDDVIWLAAAALAFVGSEDDAGEYGGLGLALDAHDGSCRAKLMGEDGETARVIVMGDLVHGQGMCEIRSGGGSGAGGECRFCGCALAAGEECTDEFCAEARAKVCDKVLACGHPCCGVRGEKECPPCLHPSCAGQDARLKQDSDSMCLCLESLRSEPCLMLKCGHVFHEGCVRQQLKARWSGARIMFGFAKCSFCKEYVEHEELKDLTDEIYALKSEVEKKALMRLNYEGEEVEPGQDATEVAMKRYAYYPCFKCQRPYFGGLAVCQAARGDDSVDPSELICGACVPAAAGMKECPKHGLEHTLWKCRWCCSVAVWYCWGTTHFCGPCHDQHSLLTSMDKSSLAPCPCLPDVGGSGLPVSLGDGAECPLGVEHPPSGEEFALGCGLCRNIKEF